MSKKSIRFYNDYEVRAVWDEENAKWWFSATDIVRAINDEEDYKKAGNYWRWLKKKLNEDGVQLVSVTHDFKFLLICLVAFTTLPVRFAQRPFQRVIPCSV